MAYTITLASLSLSTHDAFALRSPKIHSSSLLPTSNLARIGATFATGSPLSWTISHRRNCSCKATPVSVRCEQSTQGGNSLDVWLDRLAMVGFAVAISVEIATGKGLLENFGLTLPTVALGDTGLVGVLTAIFIFQSVSNS